jgi:hypothetical protein
MTDAIKAITGFGLLFLVIYLLWSVLEIVFVILFGLAAFLIKWVFMAFLVFLVFAILVSMFTALIKS